jgi:sterol desaturase/sphingolipid hydroxylase (fatty acid hydroxylase superfamily)
MASIFVPQGHVLGPALFAVLIYGTRYLLLIGVFFLFLKLSAKSVSSSSPRPIGFRNQVRREVIYSVLTVLMFSVLNASLSGYGVLSHSFLYFEIADYGWLWFWVSVPLMVIVHDALFYWIHRALHGSKLFFRAHFVHHLSIHPTVLSTYSLHPWEALLEAAALAVMIFLLPVHPLAFLIFQSVSTLLNVYCHCGRDPHLDFRVTQFLRRWIFTPMTHNIHHTAGDCNYGLYFLYWDRIMGTLAPMHASGETSGQSKSGTPIGMPQ